MTRIRLPLVRDRPGGRPAVAPAARVAACNCAMTRALRRPSRRRCGLRRDGSPARMSRLVAPAGGGPPPITWTWNVERSRDRSARDTIDVTAGRTMARTAASPSASTSDGWSSPRARDGCLQTNGLHEQPAHERDSIPERDAIIDCPRADRSGPRRPEDRGLPCPSCCCSSAPWRRRHLCVRLPGRPG